MCVFQLRAYFDAERIMIKQLILPIPFEMKKRMHQSEFLVGRFFLGETKTKKGPTIGWIPFIII